MLRRAWQHKLPSAAAFLASVFLATAVVGLWTTADQAWIAPGPSSRVTIPDGEYVSLLDGGTKSPKGSYPSLTGIGGKKSELWAGAGNAFLAVEPVALDIAKRRLHVTVDVWFGCQLRQMLVDRNNRTIQVGMRRPECNPKKNAGQHLVPPLRGQYGSDVVTIVLRGQHPTFVRSRRIPLRLLYESFWDQAGKFGNEGEGTVRSLILPLLWNPPAYPFDHFYVDAFVSVVLPYDIVTRANSHSAGGAPQILRVHVLARRLDGGAIGEGAVNAGMPSSALSSLPFELQLDVTRGHLTQGYTLAIALVPLPLLLLLVHNARARRRRRRTDEPKRGNGEKGTSDAQDLLLGLGAISLTILPLRLVLVPAEITELTIIDLVLAAQLVALVLVGVWMYRSQVIDDAEGPVGVDERTG